MAKADLDGRAYAHRRDLRPGLLVELDNGFPCMHAGRQVVERDDVGHFVRCSGGDTRRKPTQKHHLEPQGDGNRGYLTGVYLVPS